MRGSAALGKSTAERGGRPPRRFPCDAEIRHGLRYLHGAAFRHELRYPRIAAFRHGLRYPHGAAFFHGLQYPCIALALLALAPATVALAQQDARSPAEPSPVEPPALELLEPVPGIAGDSDGVDAEAPDSAPTGSPRTRYNLALDEFGNGVIESAVDGFLAARDEAGSDIDLRYRSAFNLGVALAARADAEQTEEPERAIETLRTSAAWFNDAIRLAPETDEDARVNLEVVLRRIQQLADQLNRGNGLEARLDRIIDDQRGLRDSVRGLHAAIEAEGAGAEPIGFQREFEELATLERTLLAEAGSIGDLAAEERALIETRDEAERTEEERIRALQLDALNAWLQQARQSLSDARRRLRRLEAERAHERAEGALAELKRAREQLLDPVTVLRRVAQDQTLLLSHSQALALLASGNLRLDAEDGPAAVPPPWLDAEHLGNRQDDVSARTGEVLARFGAGAGDEATEPPPDASVEQRRLFEAVREAVPLLRSALVAMRDTEVSLATAALGPAVESEAEALRMLYRAIERFAGLRDLIELAYADQTQAVGLLTPAEDGSPLAELSTEARSDAVGEAVDANLDRLERLEGLLADERAAASNAAGAAGNGERSGGLQGASEPEADEQGAVASDASGEPGARGGGDPGDTNDRGGPGNGSGGDDGRGAADPGADAEQLQAIVERFDLAEQLRAEAAATLESLNVVLAGDADGAAGEPLGLASEALASISELRRLFFNIVEHLQELLAAQADTYDRTAAFGIAAADALDDELAAELGLATERQNEHTRTADALTQSLFEQADAASAAPAAGLAGGQAQPSGEQFAQAAEEVRAASGSMQSAGIGLTDATDGSGALTPDLEPILGDQLEAMARLENAIRLLQPPEQQQNQDDQQNEQQQQQEQRSQEQEMTQRQALSRLQAIRDREAERRRNRQQQPAQREPVERDF